MDRPHLALYAVLFVALAISVVTDLKSRKILNLVTLPALAVCLSLRLVFDGLGPVVGEGLASGAVGSLAGAGFFLPFALLGGVGMGDLKLMAAVGAGVGFPAILACLLCIGVVGGVHAIAALVVKGRLGATLVGMARPLLRRLGRARLEVPAAKPTHIPYGVSIALGTALGVWLNWSLQQTAEQMSVR